ncbi:hypothetical protein [Polyangium mundeleinium]|uniref:Alpha/beta hydrolase n=1 Tax=Polyangium mundeleinium TaxID=2995306 RepID=A0ABT5F425_9BACT|nr:hypothetical protein [Polyangium mundeleinium]MDC0748158.1 hypothetical protein [Polyangium mundeleinium]
MKRRAPSSIATIVLTFVLLLAASPAWAKGKKPPPPPPLDGKTIDYAWDGKDVGHPERAWLGRAFVHQTALADANAKRPLLVFIHGLNTERIKYRWMGGGNEGDVRRIVAGLVEAGKIPPVIVAAPSSIVPSAVTNAVTSWPAFDLDRFVDETGKALGGTASIDSSRILVAAHSGGGCNVRGGIATAIRGKTKVHAALSIDTCMLPDMAKVLASGRSDMHVIVSWQTLSWAKRPFGDFRAVFTKGVAENPAASGFLRELEHVQPREPMPHDAMVGLTLGRWLPILLPTGNGSPPTPSP